MSLVPTARVLALLAILLVGCTTKSPSSSPTRIAISDGWLAMGTFFEIEIRVPPEKIERARAFIEWARLEIPRLEKIYSRHDPETELASLNQSLASDDVLTREIQLGSELESILFLAMEVWEGSGGAFDMTVGPLVELWTRAIADGKWPSLEELRAAKARVGSQAFLLVGDGKLEALKRGMRVDLDGISKGVVLDRLRETFQADLPQAAALLSFGESSIMAIGDPDGRGWRLEIRSQESSAESHSVVHLRDKALSVSSSLGTSSELAGERVSQIIDPRTGSILSEGVEAIVLADRSSMADGWSTALLVVGANRTAVRLMKKTNLEATILESSGRSVSTDGWERVLISP